MKETVYSSEPLIRNWRQLFRDMIYDMINCRELAWQFFIRDLKASYRQTIGGFLWIFIPPIITTLTFTFLNAQKIISFAETPVPYAPYVFVGTLLWGSFQESVLNPLKSLEQNKQILIKINFPSEAVLFGSLGTIIFNLLIRMLLVLPVFILFDVPLSSSILLAPLGFLGIILLGLAISIILAPLSLLYKDVQRSLATVMGFWMFLTPVIYPPPTGGFASVLSNFNPVSPLLITARDWIFGFQPEHTIGFCVIVFFSIVVIIASWLLYRLAKPHVIARLGM